MRTARRPKDEKYKSEAKTYERNHFDDKEIKKEPIQINIYSLFVI